MAAKLTTYRFYTADGEDVDGPVWRDHGNRKFDSDAQAELHAKRLSEDENGAGVRIRRPGGDWVVRCGFIPHPPAPGYTPTKDDIEGL